MTREDREDAIDIIQSILDKYEEDECLVTEITIGDEDIKAFKMAIKALEQEPVLDKIRAEILEKCFDVPYENQAFDYGLKIVKWSDVREILDKYNADRRKYECRKW